MCSEYLFATHCAQFRFRTVMAAAMVVILPCLAQAGEVNLVFGTPELSWGLASGDAERQGNSTGYFANEVLSESAVKIDMTKGSVQGLVSSAPTSVPLREFGNIGVSINFLVTNNSDQDIKFHTGAFAARLSSSYSLMAPFPPFPFPPSVSSASATTALTAGLGGTVIGSLTHTATEFADETITQVIFPIGDISLIDVFQLDGSGYDVSIRSAPYTLMAHSGVRFAFSIGLGAATGGFGGDAVVDAMNSFHLIAKLPEGVTYKSDQPLSWVSTVPENSTMALFAFGFSALALRRLRYRTGATHVS